MNIVMFTNTYAPHVGGVARSVEAFAGAFRRRGHRVLVVAPLFPGVSSDEREVIRFPAVQHFSGSDFSVPVPVPGRVASTLRRFRPEIVHSHHPFLLGDTALRVAASRNLPVVFTHHTLYEEYTHYVPGDSPRLKRFVLDLVSGYCNLCDAVIAPSASIAELLVQREVTAPIEIIPTGVDIRIFAAGDGPSFRKSRGIPSEAFVVGHVGRLAPEKNLDFLAEGVARFLLRHDKGVFLVAGEGAGRETLTSVFAAHGLSHRLILAGVLDRRALADAYGAMDLFAFASHTETQGMVLAEAMAAGVPVVALDAGGVRDIVRDGRNGRLLGEEDREAFAAALTAVADLPMEGRRRFSQGAFETAEEFSLSRTAARTLALYERLAAVAPSPKDVPASRWNVARRRAAEEWKILRNLAHAVGDAVRAGGKVNGGKGLPADEVGR